MGGRAQRRSAVRCLGPAAALLCTACSQLSALGWVFATACVSQCAATASPLPRVGGLLVNCMESLHVTGWP